MRNRGTLSRKMIKNCTALHNRVVVEATDAESVSPGGIILPDAAQKKPTEGIVQIVGPGRRLDNGDLVMPTVKPGDRVLYSKYGGSDITVDGKEYTVLDEDQIYLILPPKES